MFVPNFIATQDVKMCQLEMKVGKQPSLYVIQYHISMDKICYKLATIMENCL